MIQRFLYAVCLIAAVGCSSSNKADNQRDPAQEKATKEAPAKGTPTAETGDAATAPAVPKGEEVPAIESSMAESSEVAEPTDDEKYNVTTTCEKDSDKRVFVVAKVGNGCELRYTRGSAKYKPAYSKFSMQHCEKVRDKMRKNLEGSGYDCI